MCVGWGGVALDQISDAVGKQWVVDDVEEAPAAVLATGAVGARQRALLVHVAKDGVVGVGIGRYADLRVVEVRAGSPFETERLPFPLPRHRNLHRPCRSEIGVPA